MTPDSEPATDAETPEWTGAIGAWLCAQRLARKWTTAEMGRQLRHAARESGDNAVPAAAALAQYVRRWERDDLFPSQRYLLLYSTALDIPLDRFPARLFSQDLNGGKLKINGTVLSGYNSTEPNIVVVAVIPPGCPGVVIHLSSPDMR